MNNFPPISDEVLAALFLTVPRDWFIASYYKAGVKVKKSQR